MTKKTYFYDLEVFSNLFTATFKEYNKDNFLRFIVWFHPERPELIINQLPGLLDLLYKGVIRLIGYNNKEYDDLILNFLLYNREIMTRSSARRITQEIKILSNRIISSQDKRREREKAIKEKMQEERKMAKLLQKDKQYKGTGLTEIIEQQRAAEQTEEEYRPDPSLIGELKALSNAGFFQSLDMIRMFSTIERIGLKQVAINLKRRRVQDLPFPLNHIFTKQEEIDIVLDYNQEDVLITEHLLRERSEDFKFRAKTSKQYNINVLDANDTDIGKAIISKYYLEETKMSPAQFKKGRSYYSYVDIKDCISKRIIVRSAESIKLLKALKKIRVDLTKEEEGKQFHQIYRSSYITHTVAMGGIHSINPPEIISEDDDHYFLDIDVSGYYSSIIVEDKLYPRHLGPIFTKVYKEKVHIPKLLAKEEKDEITASTLKIASLSIYGLTKSNTSPFYDPKMTTTVCVSGEMYLIMLIEAIEKYTHAMIVYSNTDGLRIRVPKREYFDLLRVCKIWECYTGFQLTYKRLRKLIIRDVNNFILFTYDEAKPIKAAGDFAIERKLSKGYDNPVIALAINRFYEKGIPIEDTINNCSDLFMYMKAQKVDTDKFIVRLERKDGKNVDLQKNNRWIVTTNHPDEGKLYKIHKEGKNKGEREEMQKGYFVTVVNDLPEGEEVMPDNQHVNYSFYINETLKIVNQLKPSLNKPHEHQIVEQLKISF